MVTAVIAPAHIRSMAKPGTERGSPARIAALRPIVRPWSPVWVAAAMATSSIRSGGSPGCRRSSSRITLTTMSSARVWAYWPFSPALPNGVRTPSTKTTSRSVRGGGRTVGRMVCELVRLKPRTCSLSCAGQDEW